MKLLLPTSKQWKNWSLPSKQTNIGMWAGIISVFLAVVALFSPIGINYINAKNQTISEIKQSIEARSEEVRLIQKLQNKLRPVSSLITQDEVGKALEELNQYGYESNQILNYSAIHRMIKTNGSPELLKKFGSKLNNVHNKLLALSTFLIKTAQNTAPESEKQHREIRSKYLLLFNKFIESQSEYHGFIIDLVPADFGF